MAPTVPGPFPENEESVITVVEVKKLVMKAVAIDSDYYGYDVAQTALVYDTENDRDGYKSKFQYSSKTRDVVPGQCCHDGFSAAFDLVCDAGTTKPECEEYSECFSDGKSPPRCKRLAECYHKAYHGDDGEERLKGTSCPPNTKCTFAGIDHAPGVPICVNDGAIAYKECCPENFPKTKCPHGASKQSCPADQVCYWPGTLDVKIGPPRCIRYDSHYRNIDELDRGDGTVGIRSGDSGMIGAKAAGYFSDSKQDEKLEVRAAETKKNGLRRRLSTSDGYYAGVLSAHEEQWLDSSKDKSEQFVRIRELRAQKSAEVQTKAMAALKAKAALSFNNAANSRMHPMNKRHSGGKQHISGLGGIDSAVLDQFVPPNSMSIYCLEQPTPAPAGFDTRFPTHKPTSAPTKAPPPSPAPTKPPTTKVVGENGECGGASGADCADGLSCTPTGDERGGDEDKSDERGGDEDKSDERGGDEVDARGSPEVRRRLGSTTPPGVCKPLPTPAPTKPPTKKGGLGMPCSLGDKCQEGLECQMGLKVGDACTEGSNECATGLACEKADDARGGFLCTGEPSDDSIGKCSRPAPRTAPPTPNPFETDAPTQAPTKGPRKMGEACSADSECKQGLDCVEGQVPDARGGPTGFVKATSTCETPVVPTQPPTEPPTPADERGGLPQDEAKAAGLANAGDECGGDDKIACKQGLKCQESDRGGSFTCVESQGQDLGGSVSSAEQTCQQINGKTMCCPKGEFIKRLNPFKPGKCSGGSAPTSQKQEQLEKQVEKQEEKEEKEEEKQEKEQEKEEAEKKAEKAEELQKEEKAEVKKEEEQFKEETEEEKKEKEQKEEEQHAEQEKEHEQAKEQQTMELGKTLTEEKIEAKAELKGKPADGPNSLIAVEEIAEQEVEQNKEPLDKCLEGCDGAAEQNTNFKSGTETCHERQAWVRTVAGHDCSSTCSESTKSGLAAIASEAFICPGDDMTAAAKAELKKEKQNLRPVTALRKGTKGAAFFSQESAQALKLKSAITVKKVSLGSARKAAPQTKHSGNGSGVATGLAVVAALLVFIALAIFAPKYGIIARRGDTGSGSAGTPAPQGGEEDEAGHNRRPSNAGQVDALTGLPRTDEETIATL